MDFEVKNKTALVSGSSQGIGFAIAKRFILPQEVAGLVVYLCSPLAAATNGAAVRIDGGVVEAIP